LIFFIFVHYLREYDRKRPKRVAVYRTVYISVSKCQCRC